MCTLEFAVYFYNHDNGILSWVQIMPLKILNEKGNQEINLTDSGSQTTSFAKLRTSGGKWIKGVKVVIGEKGVTVVKVVKLIFLFRAKY